MLVGICIELLQPGFDLLHQLIFLVLQRYLKQHPFHLGHTTQPPIKLREWLDAQHNLRITASRSAKHAHE